MQVIGYKRETSCSRWQKQQYSLSVEQSYLETNDSRFETVLFMYSPYNKLTML